MIGVFDEAIALDVRDFEDAMHRLIETTDRVTPVFAEFTGVMHFVSDRVLELDWRVNWYVAPSDAWWEK